MADAQVIDVHEPEETFRAPTVPMSDLYPYPGTRRLRSARADDSDPQLLRLTWDDGETRTLHALMLRENCPCLDCRHPVTLERTLDQLGYPLDVAADELFVTADGGLRVVWSPGGHVSEFAPGWLFAGGRPEAVLPTPAPRLWGAELAENLPRFAFDAVMADDAALLAWLETLRDVGLTYVTGAPTEVGVVGRLVHRVAHIRETNFGVVFDVVNRPDSVSNAYTAIDLPLHVDLPTREYQPGYQFLHCIVNQATGGLSRYADGFRMADELRRRDPEAFALLCRVPVAHRYHDGDVDYVTVRPVIVTDTDGAVSEIRYNPSLMQGFDGPPEDSRAFYAAYRAFAALARDPALEAVLRMAPGEVACFDNRRVMHGRAAFDPQSGPRHLQGCYLEREEVYSRIRTLRRQVETV